MSVKKPRLYLVFPAVALAVFALHAFSLVNFHEDDAVDLRFRLRGTEKAHPAVTIVVVDDASLKAFGQWPWPRSVHAAFLGVLLDYVPQTVFFDMLFTEEGADPADDELFAGAVEKSGNVILPFFYESLDPFRPNFPIKALRKAAYQTAFVNAVEDTDGHVRKAKTHIDTAKGVFYPPAVLMASDFMQKEDPVRGIPVDSRGNMSINFPGTLESFRSVSYSDVISFTESEEGAAHLKDLFEGRLVLVGHMATGTTDLKSTSFSLATPGVVAHAAALNTILTGKYISEAPFYVNFLLVFFLTCGGALLFKVLRPAPGLAALLGLAAAYFAVTQAAFLLFRIVFVLFVPMTGAALAYILTLFMKYTEIHFLREVAEKELEMAARIQNEFLPAVPPHSTHFELGFETRFLKSVGGDLYDWAVLGEEKFAFAVGDVSGKGMPAAIYMAKALSDFRSLDKKEKAPGKVLEEMNSVLLSHPTAGMFLTLFYGVVDTANRKFHYSSAGHEPFVIWRKSGKKTESASAAHGLPLAMFETSYETAVLDWEPGDCLLFFSDGVKELRSETGREFGLEGIQKALVESAARQPTAAGIVKDLFERMARHQGKSAAHDDRTLFCLKFGETVPAHV